MGFELGVLFGFGASVFWGVGDFLIQRTARRIGDWEALLAITAFGALALTPFVLGDLGFVRENFSVLLLVSGTLFAASLLDFEALKQGKIAIIEPVMALEVPVSATLAFVLISEEVNALQALLIAVIIAGIVLVSLKSTHLKEKKWIEKGAVLAVLASALMGASGFLVGFASRETSPFIANWFSSLFMAVACLAYLSFKGRLAGAWEDFMQNKRLVLAVSFVDNAAWVCFAFAVITIPIAIAMALSESYVALAALLGVVVSKERLLNHQRLGVFVVIAGAVVLAAMTA